MKLSPTVLGTCGLLILLLVVRVGQAVGESIGLFSTPDCSSCNLTIHQGEQRSFYVSAPIESAMLEAFGGGEFKISGIPSGWTVVNVVPGPGINVLEGSPVTGGVLFSIPAGAPSLCTLLFRIDLLATSEEHDLRIQVADADGPSHTPVPLDCPVIYYYLDTFICANAGALLVNSPLDCSVGVTSVPWGMVKELYRR